MDRASRPAIATGIAMVGAALIGVVPATTTAPPDLQHRDVQLTTAGEINFPEVDWNDFVANTTANWNGLMQMFDHTTAIYSLPDAVYTQGLTQVFNDLSTDVQELAKYSAALSAYDAAVAAQNGELNPTGVLPPIPTFPDLYNDPVLNPVSALTLVVQNGLASGFGANALEVGWTGIYQNMLPSINDINTEFSGTIIPGINGGLTAAVNAVNTGIDTLNNTIAPVVNGVLSIYNGCIDNSICDAALTLFNGGTSPGTASDISSSLIPKIPASDIPSITPIDADINHTFDLPDVTGPSVPLYTFDIGQNEMAILSSIAGLAAPVTGTVSSADFGNFLAPDPIMNLGSLFDSAMASLLAIIPGDPLTLSASLPLDWANLVAESLQNLFTT